MEIINPKKNKVFIIKRKSSLFWTKAGKIKCVVTSMKLAPDMRNKFSLIPVFNDANQIKKHIKTKHRE